MSSVFAGGLLSLIQVLLVGRQCYQYLKQRKTKNNRVQPIAIPEIQNTSPTILADSKNFFEDKFVETSLRSISFKSNSSAQTKHKDSSEDVKMLEFLGRMSPAFFERKPKGKYLYRDLKKWWGEVRSEFSEEARNFSPKGQEMTPKGPVLSVSIKSLD